MANKQTNTQTSVRELSSGFIIYLLLITADTITNKRLATKISNKEDTFSRSLPNEQFAKRKREKKGTNKEYRLINYFFLPQTPSLSLSLSLQTPPHRKNQPSLPFPMTSLPLSKRVNSKHHVAAM